MRALHFSCRGKLHLGKVGIQNSLREISKTIRAWTIRYHSIYHYTTRNPTTQVSISSPAEKTTQAGADNVQVAYQQPREPQGEDSGADPGIRPGRLSSLGRPPVWEAGWTAKWPLRRLPQAWASDKACQPFTRFTLKSPPPSLADWPCVFFPLLPA